MPPTYNSTVKNRLSEQDEKDLRHLFERAIRVLQKEDSNATMHDIALEPDTKSPVVLLVLVTGKKAASETKRTISRLFDLWDQDRKKV